MLLYQNLEVYLSVFIFLVTKLLCYFQKRVMTNPLPSIDENDTMKWVSKKKHEVLKAKYKCLKKLFQIYDASVIGILPESYVEPYEEERKKRSKRTITDALVGTTEESNGDITIQSEPIKESKKDCFTQDCKENVSVQSEFEKQKSVTAIPYYKERRPTRFQCFLQRIFGLKPEINTRMYASDNDIDRRRRRGLRFRRVRRPKRTRSESILRDMKSPMILSYVQSVQRNCLLESTPRQCPIAGCKMMFYGIINYNDHLNLCHFPERHFICHYCHEGFTKEIDKVIHENEHLGISKLNANIDDTGRVSRKIASVTQTEPDLQVPEEKLKKIVSFFDKITNPEEIIQEIKKQCSESNLQTATVSESKETILEKKSGKFTISYDSNATQSATAIRCQLCGEQFDNRRQLSLHIDVEHRKNEKFSKFHSCAGIINSCPKKTYQPSEVSEFSKSDSDSNSKESSSKESNSKISNFQESSIKDSNFKESSSNKSIISDDPSTNIVYYTSLESLSKKSVVNSLVQKVRSGFCYKWEPGTKIIRV